MFSLNDKVVYAGHGVARISRIIERRVGLSVCKLFELTFLNKDMTVLVPINNANHTGVRKLSSPDNVNLAYGTIAEQAKHSDCPELTASSWNKRNRDYHNKLRTGSLQDLSEIYRDLSYVSTYKELSFGEKNLLKQTEQLLAEEISEASKTDPNDIIAHIRSVLHAPSAP
jgi:CarD family transcriptional regulator